MTTRYYRKAWEIVGYTFHADCYCKTCGDKLPEVDPEGNDKHPIFVSDELPDYWYCADCGEDSQDW